MHWWNTREFATETILVGGTLLISLLVWTVHRHCARHRLTAQSTGWRGIFDAAAPPIQFATWFYCSYFALPLAFHFFHPEWQAALNRLLVAYFWHLGLIIGFFWFLYRMVRLFELRLGAAAAAAPAAGRLDHRLFPFFALALRTLIPFLAAGTLLELFPLSPEVREVLKKWLGVAFTVGVAWIVQNGIMALERAILGGSDTAKTEDFAARGIQTRVRILRKLAIVCNVLLALAFILLQFDEVRSFGKSILASAGIAGIILGFAAQQTLGTIFAGLQIALSQPIRLGDQVIVEGESGIIE